MRQKQVDSCENVTQFILVLLFINDCVVFHMNNCKPAFAPAWIVVGALDLENHTVGWNPDS